MLFNSFQFFLFACAVVLLFRALPRVWRNPLLLGASLVFYTLWIPSYLLLLLADIGINYALMRWMQRSTRPRAVLIASVAFTLGLLGVFKYAALVVETAAPALAAGFGIELPVPDLFLPLGISFYSFQIVALMVDVQRGNVEAPPSLARFALFICFFPQLIAGPILRGAEFLPQLERGGEPNAERSRRGAWLIASGLVKKVLFADFLLASFVEDVFSAPGVGSIGIHVVAAWSFAFQIYFDFSGYTDIARGVALLLGFELPLNFLEPYLARSPAEFWRRWHITLSSWLRDYLYIGLGGNRRGPQRTQANLMITMLLGGLWHGAAWNFVIWGGLHGLLLVVHRRLGRGSGDADRPLQLSDAGNIFLLFNAVCLIWVFFRAASFELAWRYLVAIFAGHGLFEWPVAQLGIVLLCAALHAAERYLRLHSRHLQAACAGSRYGAVIEGAALGAVVALVVAASGVGGEFIYFQF